MFFPTCFPSAWDLHMSDKICQQQHCNATGAPGPKTNGFAGTKAGAVPGVLAAAEQSPGLGYPPMVMTNSLENCNLLRWFYHKKRWCSMVSSFARVCVLFFSTSRFPTTDSSWVFHDFLIRKSGFPGCVGWNSSHPLTISRCLILFDSQKNTLVKHFEKLPHNNDGHYFQMFHFFPLKSDPNLWRFFRSERLSRTCCENERRRETCVAWSLWRESWERNGWWVVFLEHDWLIFPEILGINNHPNWLK